MITNHKRGIPHKTLTSCACNRYPLGRYSIIHVECGGDTDLRLSLERSFQVGPADLWREVGRVLLEPALFVM